MMKRRYVLASVMVVVCCCWLEGAYAQTSPTASSSALPSLTSAKLLISERNFTEAAQMLTLLAKRDSMNTVIFRYLGDAQLSLDNTEAAIPAFERSVRLDSTNIYSIIALAKIFRDRAQQKEARALFRQVYRLEAKNQAALMGIAQTFFEQEQFDSALVWYERIPQPTASIYLQKARCYAELGNEARAGDAYTSAVTLAPTSVALLLERVDYWLKQGQSNEAAYNVAEQYAKEAARKFPNDTRFERRRAEALLLLRRPEAAYNALYTCIVLGDSVADVWRDAGIASYLRKQYTVADSLFAIAQAKYEAKSEIDSRLLYFRGLAKRELGLHADAVEYFRGAMLAGGKGRQVSDIHTQIGLSYRKSGRTELARDAYAHALATDSSRAEPYYELATLLDDVAMKFPSELARTKHRELVAPLYFKFLERSTNKSTKTVEFALMRLYILGAAREEVEAHCGWLKGREAFGSTTPSSSLASPSSSISSTGATTGSVRTSSASQQVQDSLVQMMGADGNLSTPTDSSSKTTRPLLDKARSADSASTKDSLTKRRQER
jgi:tetratricopeptide (TPR) repeat protein